MVNNKNKLYLGSLVLVLIIIVILFILFPQKLHLKNENFLNFNNSQKYNVSSKDRKILLVYAGGTIGMVETPNGYEPKKGYLSKQLKKILELHPKHKLKLSPYHLIEFDPLLDSSNMNLKDWNKVIKMIKDNYEHYDAFIVIHGTDTLSYTATALSFAFQNLTKPIIVTGSQIPLQRIRNDGANNLLSAMTLGSSFNIPEVMVVFGNSILRGNRSVKISSNKIDAFGCPNFKDIGAFGYRYDPQIDQNLIETTKGTSSQNFGFLNIHYYNPQDEVFTFFLSPGTAFKPLKDVIINNPHTKAVIIRTFGIGDGPTSNKEFIELLEFLNTHNILVVNISQCIEGRVDQGDYAVGHILKKHHVISGLDMTFEAVYCKLLFLLNLYKHNNPIIIQKLHENIAGELSKDLLVVDVDPTLI